jgi:hypothetical protein
LPACWRSDPLAELPRAEDGVVENGRNVIRVAENEPDHLLAMRCLWQVIRNGPLLSKMSSDL